ncbi:hypothetical protein JOD64_004683 [Micromonospora luteifusca]|uniref:Uncharacterized protein n=1 Tax=Micromonospora luteifusca TaxID=709860 RepID=A0ABS2LZ52_9ACTN|nr:hypothetical protein [Micromonospora luteifusca]
MALFRLVERGAGEKLGTRERVDTAKVGSKREGGVKAIVLSLTTPVKTFDETRPKCPRNTVDSPVWTEVLPVGARPWISRQTTPARRQLRLGLGRLPGAVMTTPGSPHAIRPPQMSRQERTAAVRRLARSSPIPRIWLTT